MQERLRHTHYGKYNLGTGLGQAQIWNKVKQDNVILTLCFSLGNIDNFNSIFVKVT
jgi:hypothetical protein